MNARLAPWLPSIILVLGIALTLGAHAQTALPLRIPLRNAVPRTLAGFGSEDATLSADELRVVGASSYLVRSYRTSDARAGFSLYVGYYDRQSRGRTIHSPRNCLPGAGWEELSSQQTTIATAQGPVPANMYLIQRKVGTLVEQALVIYWYQGRGRVVADEYAVKWNLLRDAALRHRSDEALVRIVVPVTGTAADASTLARQAASALIPAVSASLPS